MINTKNKQVSYEKLCCTEQKLDSSKLSSVPNTTQRDCTLVSGTTSSDEAGALLRAARWIADERSAESKSVGAPVAGLRPCPRWGK